MLVLNSALNRLNPKYFFIMAKQAARLIAAKRFALTEATDLKFTNAIYCGNSAMRSTKVQPMNSLCAF